MKALIIGFGSAGKRHYKILKKIKKIKQIFIFSKRKNKKKKFINTVNEIKKLNPDYVIIANETHQHLKFLKYCEKNFKKKIILVEKPLFHKYIKFKIKNNKVFVAYNLRENLILKFIKSNINLNDAFYVSSEVLSYLPDWRKSDDYTKNYSASRKKGGGVLLDLSHEIDYLIWLFKKLSFKTSLIKKISPLKINSEDFAFVSGIVSNKTLFTLKMSYFHKKSKRNLYIASKNYHLKVDFLKNEITKFQSNKKNILKFKKMSQFETTKNMHTAILNKKFKDICTFKEGLKINYLIDKIKKKN